MRQTIPSPFRFWARLRTLSSVSSVTVTGRSKADLRMSAKADSRDGLARLFHEGVRGEMMGGDEAVGLA